jgi:RNA polymerase sigma-70 factor, ECF subfamily
MEPFETYRPYLFAIAYRMLGSAMDAEDLVQETYLRYQAAHPESLHSLKAYLTTILVRLCRDQLQLARRKREQYVGPWLPEPILTKETLEAADPQERVEKEESISLAFLILLEQLQPFERAIFLLREVFEYEFTEIAAMLEKSEGACRRSFSRAKQHLQAQQPRFQPAKETHRQLLTSFLQAVTTGETNALTNILAEQVTFWADGGGKVKGAPIRPFSGRIAVVRFFLGTQDLWPQNARPELGEVNGQPALIVRTSEKAFSVLVLDVEHGQIQSIWAMANPDKLSRV